MVVVCLLLQGVPYAAAPVGALRFQKPRPPQPWQGCRRCTAPGPMSVQSLSLAFRAFMPSLLGSLTTLGLRLAGLDPRLNTDWRRPQRLMAGVAEDCLYLNIETPALPLPDRPQREEGGEAGAATGGQGGLRPVMVWVHGGSFQVGSGSLPAYQDPQHRLSCVEGVVLVTINYRLGLLGFLKVEGGDYNCGLWDQASQPARGGGRAESWASTDGWCGRVGYGGANQQVAALEWVRANISAFGGDPGKVTLMGESAGAISVGVHLISPHSRGERQG